MTYLYILVEMLRVADKLVSYVAYTAQAIGRRPMLVRLGVAVGDPLDELLECDTKVCWPRVMTKYCSLSIEIEII